MSGILTRSGTILDTGRDKVHRMQVDGQTRNMVPTDSDWIAAARTVGNGLGD